MALHRIGMRIAPRVQLAPQTAAVRIGVRLPPALQIVPQQQQVRIGFVAGPRGSAGENAAAEPQVIVADAAPAAGYAVPTIRIALDSNGRATGIYLGTP